MVRFNFEKNWVHAGVKYKPGDSTELTLEKAEKLKKLGAGKFDEPVKDKPQRGD